MITIKALRPSVKTRVHLWVSSQPSPDDAMHLLRPLWLTNRSLQPAPAMCHAQFLCCCCQTFSDEYLLYMLFTDYFLLHQAGSIESLPRVWQSCQCRCMWPQATFYADLTARSKQQQAAQIGQQGKLGCVLHVQCGQH
jgi:hypothetical protein